MRTLQMLSGLLVVASTVGCVSAGKYDAALADAQRAQSERDSRFTWSHVLGRCPSLVAPTEGAS